MLNLTRQTVKLPTCGEQEELVVVFDHTEARGTLILRECAYGLEVLIPSLSPYPVAVLDFWHTSETGQIDRDPVDPAPVAQIVIHSPAQTEDPVGRVRFFPQRTSVDFERGIRAETSPAGSAWGYPLDAYPPVELLVNHAGVQVYRALVDGKPSPHWFTTDPDRADFAQDGPHFCLRDLLPDRAPHTRAHEHQRALADPACLRDALIQAIDRGQVTTAGLAVALLA